MPESHSGSQRRLIGNIFSLYLLQGLNYLIPLAVLPYLVRVLGMYNYGLISFAQSFAQYFTTFTDYGFNYSATRSIAKKPDDTLATSRTFCCVLLIKLSLMLFGALILGIVILFVPRFRHDSAFFLVAYLAVFGNVLFPVWYFQGIQKMRYISIITGAAKILSAALLFVFVRKPDDALLALAIQSAGITVAGFAGLWVSLHGINFKIQWPSRTEVKSTLLDGWHLFISSAAVSLYSNTNVFLVGMLAGNIQAGYFSIAEKLIRAIAALVGPISQALFPHVSSLAESSTELALNFIRRTMVRLGTLTIIFSAILFIFAAPIALLCFGPGAAGSVPIIRWISLLPFLITMSTVLGVQTMVALGLDKQFSSILLLAGIMNVALAIPLILTYQAVGAGACVLFTESAVTIAMGVVLMRSGINLFSVTTRTV